MNTQKQIHRNRNKKKNKSINKNFLRDREFLDSFRIDFNCIANAILYFSPMEESCDMLDNQLNFTCCIFTSS
jgi:hypothetical protein